MEKENKRRGFVFPIIIFLIFLLLSKMEVYASADSLKTINVEENPEEWNLEKWNANELDIEGLDINELNREWKETFPDYKLDLKHTYELFKQGNILEGITIAGQDLLAGFWNQISGYKNFMIKLLVLGIMSAAVNGIVMAFEQHQTVDICHYFLYLFLCLLLLEIFREAYALARSALEQIVLFMKMFLPAFFAVIVYAGGWTTGTAFYQWILLIIYAEEEILVCWILPIIEGYFYLGILGGIWLEERLRLLSGLLKKGVELILKCLIGIVSGIGVMQSMITSVIDSNRLEIVQHTVSVIPGAGAAAEGMTKIFAGSAALIRNSAGSLLLVLLILICIYPGIKLLIFTVMLKAGASVISLLGNKEIAVCTEQVGSAVFLLLRMVITVMVLFFLTIAISLYCFR